MGLAILCYHRVLPDNARTDPRYRPYFMRGTAVSEETFEAQVRGICANFDVVGEADVLDWLDGRRSLPRRACWITFDDGYRDVIDRAAPVLAPRRLPATAFVTTRMLGDRTYVLPADAWYATLAAASRTRGTLHLPGMSPWTFDLATDYARLVDGPERRQYLRAPATSRPTLLASLAQALDAEPTSTSNLYLTPPDLTRLVELGWSIGGHGHTHMILSEASTADVSEEVTVSRNILRSAAIDARTFAYPDGAWSTAVAESLHAASWRAAVALGNALASPSLRYALKRFIPPDNPAWIPQVVASTTDA